MRCRARQATQKFLSLVVRQWRGGVVARKCQGPQAVSPGAWRDRVRHGSGVRPSGLGLGGGPWPLEVAPLWAPWPPECPHIRCGHLAPQAGRGHRPPTLCPLWVR